MSAHRKCAYNNVSNIFPMHILSGAQPEFFQGRGGFAELGYFNKKFC